MLRMAVGHSDDFDAAVAVAEVVSQCLTELADAKPQAGLMFVGPGLDAPEFHRLVIAALPNIELIGGTSGAEMSSVLGFGEDSFTLALFSSDVLEFGAGIGASASQGVRAACREATEMAQAKLKSDPALCLTVPSVTSIDPDDVVAGLSDLLGNEVAVIGGAAAIEDERADAWGGDYQFCGDQVLSDAVPILLIAGAISYSFGVAHGWEPLGRMGVVTRSRGNVVYEIDGEPTRTYYDRYVRTDTGNALLTPLAVYEPDTERFYLRSARDFEEDGSAVYLGSVPEGATVQIAAVAGQDQILDATDQALDDALSGFPNERPEAAMVVSCVGRKFLLGSRAASEVEQVRKRLGEDVPVVGFYGYGEIAPLALDGDPRLHNGTCVAVLLGT